MDRNKYNSAIFDLRHSSSLWKKIAFVMLGSNLLLSIFLISINSREKTIVVPPGLKQAFWVKGDYLSPAYLEQISWYFFGLLLTYSPSNCLYQFQQILLHVSPEAHSTMQTDLLNKVEEIKRKDFSSVFYPASLSIEGMEAIVEGEHLGHIGKEIVSRHSKKYSLTFQYRSGILYIKSFKQIIQGNSHD